MTERQRLETTYADLRPDDQIEDKSGNRWLLAELNKMGKAWVADFWLCDPVSNIKMYQISKPVEDPVTVWRLPKHADQVAQLEAEFPEPQIVIDHSFESFDGASGFSCTRMVTRPDGTADQCGRSSAEHHEPVYPDQAIATVTEQLARPKVGSEVMAEAATVIEEIADKLGATVDLEAPSFDPETATVVMAEILGATVDLEVAAAEIDAAIVAEDTGIPIELLSFEDMTDLEKRSHLYVLHGIYATDVQSRQQLTETHDEAHDWTIASRAVPHTHTEASK